MDKLIIYNDLQILEQRSYSYGSFASIGHDNRDIIFHLCSDINNDLKTILEYILQLEPTAFVTTKIKIYEKKNSKLDTIFGQKIFKVSESYYSTVIVDYYCDDAKLHRYNQIHKDRFPLRDKKTLSNKIETFNSSIYGMTTNSSIGGVKIYCSKKVWNKAIARYKLNT